MDVADCSILLLLDQSAAFNSADQTARMRQSYTLLFLTAFWLLWEGKHHRLNHIISMSFRP